MPRTARTCRPYVQHEAGLPAHVGHLARVVVTLIRAVTPSNPKRCLEVCGVRLDGPSPAPLGAGSARHRLNWGSRAFSEFTR